MKQKITFELSRIERESGVRVLYAGEAGARAWGIASPDAGHIVQFLFTGKGPEFRGVIEKAACKGLTLHGVDLQQGLNQLLDSHAPLLDLLRSPEVYVDGGPFAEKFRLLAGRFFDADRSHAQYLRLARRIYAEHLREGRATPGKYLEAVRAALAARWVTRERVPPPVNFFTLAEETLRDAPLKAAIEDAGRQVQRGRAAQTDALHDFLTGEILRPDAPTPKRERAPRRVTYLHDAHLQEAC